MRRISWWVSCGLACGLVGCGGDDAGALGAGGAGAAGGAAGATTGGTAGVAAGGAGGSGAGGAGAGGVGTGGTGATGGGSGGSGATGTQLTWTRHTVGQLPGAAWSVLADFEGDGQDEIIAVGFGALAGLAAPVGQVKLYRRGATLADWTETTLVPTTEGLNFPNAPTVTDVDGDGDLDLVLPTGFLVCTAIPGGQPCGGLFWYENQGATWAQHTLIPKGAPLFYHHAEVVDFDGDGIRDLVTVGEAAAGTFGGTPARAEAQWLKGIAGGERFETTVRVIGTGGGSVPTVTDIDGDGDLDVASAQYFATDASFVWFERTAEPSASAPAGTFVKRVIDATSGPSMLLTFVPDLYGDGVRRAVGTNHTNTAKVPPDTAAEGVFVLEPTADPRQPWTRTMISTGIRSRAGTVFAPQGAPGVFALGDVDGDGDTDVAVSGDGDPRVFWLEQSPGGWFTHVVAEGVGQAGGIQVTDFDANQKAELLVPVYEANAVYLYARD